MMLAVTVGAKYDALGFYFLTGYFVSAVLSQFTDLAVVGMGFYVVEV